MNFESGYQAENEVYQPRFELGSRGQPNTYELIKRAIDLIFSISLITLLTPLIAVIALYIFCGDRGSPLFIQERIGLGGVKFRCFKFRTMVVNAEQKLNVLLSTDPLALAEWEKDQKLRSDPRITRLGRFLRKSSLDELPQLWNIIRGEMSFIGPRPIVETEIKRYGRFYSYYVSVKPGVSGLWQVSGRNDTTYKERVLLDVAYAKKRTFKLDALIALKTFPVIFFSKGAY